MKDLFILDLYNKPNVLRDEYNNFIQFDGQMQPSEYAGWKYTIIGKTIEDSEFLLQIVGFYCILIGVTFKMATTRQLNCGNVEQSRKLMTIYIRKNDLPETILKDIKVFLRNYKGHEGISLKHSEHIEGAIYKRHDLDAEGNYIKAG